MIQEAPLNYLYDWKLNFLMKVSFDNFRNSFFQFSLMLLIKIKNIFWIRVTCHLLHNTCESPNFYRITLKDQCSRYCSSELVCGSSTPPDDSTQPSSDQSTQASEPVLQMADTFKDFTCYVRYLRVMEDIHMFYISTCQM